MWIAGLVMVPPPPGVYCAKSWNKRLWVGLRVVECCVKCAVRLSPDWLVSGSILLWGSRVRLWIGSWRALLCGDFLDARECLAASVSRAFPAGSMPRFYFASERPTPEAWGTWKQEYIL